MDMEEEEEEKRRRRRRRSGLGFLFCDFLFLPLRN